MLIRRYILRFANSNKYHRTIRCFSSSVQPKLDHDVTVLNKSYVKDDFTNVTEKILSHVGRNLHTQPHHPLSIVRQRIVNYLYKTFTNSRGNPLFSVYDNVPPVVTVAQNFDSLLIPNDHVSRSKSDCYYLNREYLLRAHTTAHQSELMLSGLDAFLVTGDVYRRDEIDSTHYPVFHQMDAVRLKSRDQLFKADGNNLQLFEVGNNTTSTRDEKKQACHTLEAVKLLEHELKSTLVGLAKHLFGKDIEYKWVETQFPFTEPSWELEVLYKGEWLEVLGCGIMQQPIILNAGITDKVGWAFGLGLERIAMCLYKIPDIRLFWSRDSGFLNQFKVDEVDRNIIYKPVSQYPQCTNDISFWLPDGREYSSKDFYDLVRTVGGDIVEQVALVDNFTHPKKKKTSHCYRIVYRHMERTLTQDEVNVVHKEIGKVATDRLGVIVR